MRKKFFIIVILFLLSAEHNISPRMTRKHVLFISSYDPSFPTFNQQLDGIKSVFNDQEIVLDIEFMDTKRIPEEDNIKIFYKMIMFKLKRLPRFDAVIAADDAAFLFAFSQINKLFYEIPIFFCGVNDIEKAKLTEKNSMIRGVVEAVSMRETVELVRRIFPERYKLAVITDGTIPGQADMKTFISESANIPLSAEILSLAEMTFDQLIERIKGLGPDYSILLIAAYTDKTGLTKDFYDSLDDIRRNSTVPIFHIYEHGMGRGILGGKMIRHYDQGREAALMLRSYFNGASLASMANLSKSPNRYLFDLKELVRFKIKGGVLPDDSIIINKSPEFYEVYKKTIFAVVIIILALLYLSIVMFINSRKLRKIVAKKTDELAESEKRWRISLECAGHVVWDWDIFKNTMYISKKLNPDFNNFSGEITQNGDEWFNEVHEEDREGLIEKIQKHIKGLTPIYENIHRIVGKGGEYKWVISRGKVMERLPDGRAARVIGTATDITDFKRIEDEVRKSRMMLQIVLDNVPIGVFWKDRDLTYIGCSNSFAKLIGKDSVNDIIGKKDIDLFDQSLAISFTKIDEEIINTGTGRLNYSDEAYYPDGSIKYLTKSKVPLIDDNGKIVGILGIYEDVTEQKKFRDENFRIQKLESVGILASGIAHDFNNLLMAIYGALSVVKESGELGEKNRLWIELAEKTCMAATDLTTKIITFSRGGVPVLQMENIELILNDAIRAKNYNSSVIINYINEMANPNIMIDGRQIRQVFLNLLKNAFEAMPDGGVVDIVSSAIYLNSNNEFELPEGNYARISISDSGTGITAHDLDKIFDPYFSTKELGGNKGQGLGLTICHSIIIQHKGKIVVRSFSGKGTYVTVYIPVAG